MPEQGRDAPSAAWREALRGLADIRSKIMAGWFGRDPDSPRADLGWTLGHERSRDHAPPSIASGWSLPDVTARERDGPDLER